MQFSPAVVAAVAAFVGVASAQSACLSSVTAIPACALGYVAEIAYSSFSCDIVDFSCQCSNLGGLYAPLSSSLAPYGDSCNLNSVANAGANFCACPAQNSASGSVTLEPYQKTCETAAVEIPGCALGYLASAGVGEGCQINDFGCQCSKFNAIQADIVTDVSSACGTVSVPIDSVLASASALCSCVTANSPAGGNSPTDMPTTSGGTGPISTPSVPISTPSVPISTPSVPISTPSVPVSVPNMSSGKVTSSPSMSSPPMQSNPTGTLNISHFTGAGATASAFGGLFAVVAGLVAYL